MTRRPAVHTLVRSLTLSALLLAIAALSPLAAQRHRPGIYEKEREKDKSGRGGFWLALGAGAGQERLNLNGDDLGYSDPLYKPTLSLRMGGTPSQMFRMGVEAFAWFNEVDDATETLSSLMLVGQLYPAPNVGFHLRGGGGVARSAVNYDFFDDTGDTGLAATIGAGWELTLSRNVYLVPSVDLYQHWYDGQGGYRERLINFGLSVQFQSGRK